MRTFSKLFIFSLFLFAASAASSTGQEPVNTGKAPIIIIPGLTGSDLYNSRTGEQVWFKPVRAKDDDLRLPISPNLTRNRDSLVARDIMRGVKIVSFLPEIEVYEKLISSLEARGGYKEGRRASGDNCFEGILHRHFLARAIKLGRAT